ncbi:MAG: FAD:protein FMN transferase [Actinobacteria bacterium]|nr:FAD:protein FMN transferase [Actinomycetota bacterium]
MTAGTNARLVFPIMGTMGSIVVSATDVTHLGVEVVEAALAAARSRLDGLEQRFSHYRGESDISRWVAGEDVDAKAVAEIEHVLRECGRLHADSDGVFRARNPRTHALDTAGYVKGYAIGRAVEELRTQGLCNFVVGVGGDAFAAGVASDDRPWRIAVQDPRRSHGVLAMVEATDFAVATSGSAERGDHIWIGDDPVVTAANMGILSFTVIGPDIAEADAYATVGFAMGEAGMAWVRGHEGYRSVVVRPDGSTVSDAALVSAA